VSAGTPAVAAEVLAADALPPEPVTWRRGRVFARNPFAVVALVFLVVVILAAVLADLVAPYGEIEADLRNRFATPLSDGHLLGTDDVGRDLLSRLLFGARVSLVAGLGSIGVALALAVPAGLLAAARPGRIDTAATWAVDVLLSIPPLILVFAMAGVLGPGLRTIVIALGVYFTPLLFRLVRAEARALMSSPLVTASVAVGLRRRTILWRHVLPNVAAPLIVESSLAVGVAITGEASLSFVGLGVNPPGASWGVMLSLAFNKVTEHPWMVFVPGVAIGLTVLAINIVGDGLRDALGRVED
jgi:ABC-type dipeptide/oligopeptide/nickel transport system permease subunit